MLGVVEVGYFNDCRFFLYCSMEKCRLDWLSFSFFYCLFVRKYIIYLGFQRFGGGSDGGGSGVDFKVLL